MQKWNFNKVALRKFVHKSAFLGMSTSLDLDQSHNHGINIGNVG